MKTKFYILCKIFPGDDGPLEFFDTLFTGDEYKQWLNNMHYIEYKLNNKRILIRNVESSSNLFTAYPVYKDI